MKRFFAAAVIGGTCCAAPVQAVDLVFDYRYDDAGFFTSERRAVLDSVARLYSDNLTDTLSAIEPAGSDFFVARIYDPLDPLNAIATVPGVTVQADEIRIFVGSYSFAGQILAVGGPGSYSAGGAAFAQLVESRGEPGALAASPTDFAPWGGTITFGSNVNWYADADVSTLESFSGQFDFFTVAMHETAHVLGIGTADSWFAQVDDGTFAGALTTALNGGVAPALRNDGSDTHFASSVAGHANGAQQVALLSATIPVGGRRYMTDLDWAALSDIGWEVASLYATVPAPVPEAPTWAMALAGLGVLGLRQRQKRAPA